MRAFRLCLPLLGAALFGMAGCHGKQAASKSNFKAAIGNYFNVHPECVWSSPVKLPAEVDASNGGQNTQYAALFDAGVLTRTTEQKKVFFFSTKQVQVYDLSSKGRSVWTPDTAQPGYGNFCFGHRDVTSVDNFTTSTNSDGNQIANVDYQWTLAGLADWASSAEIANAFPTVQADRSGAKVAQATLVNGDHGWTVNQP